MKKQFFFLQVILVVFCLFVTGKVAAQTGTMTASPDSLLFSCTSVGSYSSALTTTLTSSYLSPSSGTLSIIAPANFQVWDGSAYVSSYTVSYSGSGGRTVISVIFGPTATTFYSGYISIFGGGAGHGVYVSGTGCGACSGTPTAGSASASPSTGSSTTPFSLSISGYTSSSGITFQWQSSPTSGGTYTNISGATNATYNFTGISANTCYRCAVICMPLGYTAYSTATCVTYAPTCNLITTVVGRGVASSGGDGGAATAASINTPDGILVDSFGNMYVSEGYGNLIRKISPSGTISTFAGTGTSGYSGDGGPATAARINLPTKIIADASGNIYFADYNNNCVRKINASGIISTVAGNGSAGYSGDGGQATAASLRRPSSMAIDGSGNLYIADYSNQRIRKVTPSGIISTYAGTGGTGSSGDGGAATAATFNGPFGICLDASGNLYVADASNNKVRKISTSGIVSTFAGTGTAGHTGDGGVATAATLFNPAGVGFDRFGNLIVADQFNFCIRYISPSNIVSTVAGSGTTGYSGDGGPATAAQISGTNEAQADPYGTLYICDASNHRVRKVTAGAAPTVTAISGPTSVVIGSTITVTDATSGGTWSSSNAAVAIVDSTGIVTGVGAGSATISYTVTNACGAAVATLAISSVTCGVITTIAGTGVSGFSGDSGAATAARFSGPSRFFVTASGEIYISDYANNRIRKISGSGIVTTIAGTGSAGFSGDGGQATAAQLNSPNGIAVDGSGNIYFADYTNSRIRKINAAGIISTYAGNGSGAFSGDGGAATAASIFHPTGLMRDAAGNIFFADEGNDRIRKVTPSGIISTFAGGGSSLGDGGAATAGSLHRPADIFFDASGNAFIADAQNNRIRQVTAAGIISTIAGTGTAVFSGDGGAATAAGLNLPTGVFADNLGNLFIGDNRNNRVRKINSSGIISTYAGTGTAGYSGDGGPATAAAINAPSGVWMDGTGNFYIADQTNNCIRKIVGSVVTVSAISGPTTVCAGAGITLTDSTAGGTWSSSSPSVASVNASTGAVSGLSPGTATITYTRSGACGSAFAITTISVTHAPVTPAAITGSASVCAGGTTTLSDATTGGAWTSSNASVATVSAAGVVTGVAAGTATITYTVSNTCGTAYVTLAMIVNAAASAGTISGASSVCYGTTITMTTSGSGGTWSSSTPTIATIDPASGLVNGLGAGTVTVSYTVTGSCGAGVATKALSILVAPSAPAAIAGASTLCTGSSITLTDATTGGSWGSGNASVATINSAGVVTGVAVGSATISYVVTNSCGSANATLAITVSTAPSVAAISGSSTLCMGGTLALTDATSGGTWSSVSPSIATVNASGTVTGVSVGTATISYTVSSTCGTVAATKTVTVGTVPTVAAITGTASICTGTSTTYADATSGGTWSSSNASVANVSTSGLVSGSSAGTANISYSLTNTCGVTSAVKTITVTSSAVAGTITGPGVVCTGNVISLGETVTGGTWSSSNTSVASISTGGSVRGIAVGTTTISYTVTSSCGTNIATATVTVAPAPSAGTISGATAACTGATTTLTDATTGGSWVSSAPTVATVSAAGVVTGIAAGTAIISYSVTNSCATAIASQTMTVNATPYAGTITGASTVCTGSTTTLTNATSGGTWSSSTPSLATVSSTGVVTGIAVGSVTISYTVTTACGSATAGKIVSVSAAASAGTVSGASTLCTGATTTLTSTATGGAWTSSNNAVATVVSATGVVRGVTAGTVTISYAVTTGCGTGVATKTISVTAASSAGTITGLSSVCAGSIITLTNAVSGGAWSSANTSVASINASTGVVNGVAAGSAVISYAVTGSCGTAFATRSVTVNAATSAGTISGATSLCPGTTTTLTSSVSGGGWISSNTGVATINSAGVLTALSSGTTTITYFISGSCGTATTTRTETVSAGASAGSIAGAVTVAVGATITLSDAISGGTWSSTATSIATVSAAGVVTGVAAGIDTIKYTVTNSCGTAKANKVITVTAHRDIAGSAPATIEDATDGVITVYPNPNNGAFTLVLPEAAGEATVVITDLAGRVVDMRTGSEHNMYFVLNNVASGTYYVRVSVAGKMFSSKVVVE